MKQTKHLVVIFFALLLLNPMPTKAADDHVSVQAVPSNDFLKTIGVNTSIDNRGETYAKTRQCAEYLGFRYIRSGAGSAAWQLKELNRDFGICFSLTLGTNGDGNQGIYPTIAFAKNLISLSAPDALVGLEGPNEPNNWKITYNGETQTSTDYLPLAKYMRDYYAAVKADPVLKDYPVWTTTDAGGAQPQNYGLQFLTIPEDADTLLMPPSTTFADVACVHNYFSGISSRTNNQTWLAADRFHSNGLKANFGVTWNKKFQGYTDEELRKLRWVTTETGATIDNYDVTEEYQGLTYLSCYLAQFKHGAEYTAMYILRDRTDESGNQTFGFYKGDYTPRIAAHYLHNLTTILKDDRSIEQPGQLAYSIGRRADSPNANLETVHDLLLQKHDGTLMLVVWGERFQRSGKADKITISFGETFNQINVYNPAQYAAGNPDAGALPIASYTHTNSIDLDVLNRPFILEFNPVTTDISKVKSKNNISVYTHGNYLHIIHSVDIEKYEVFDMTGRCFLSGEIKAEKQAKIKISSLNKGYYIAKFITTDNQIQCCKFLTSEF